MIVGFSEYRNKYDFSNVRGVIHVGAHEGQEYQDYNEYFSADVPIHWFEPQREVFERLVDSLQEKKNNYFYNFGLGSSEKVLPLWKETENGGQSASFSQPQKHLEIYPHITFEESESLAIRTLDSFSIREANVLVIDVQGFEMEVLLGAIETLNRIDHIFCEINSDKLYKDSPTVDELNSMLCPKGFQLKENWWTDGNWGDGYWNKF